MTKLLQRLHDELVRRQYTTTTRESYLRIVQAFRRHVGRRLDRIGPDDLRHYQVFLLEERKLERRETPPMNANDYTLHSRGIFQPMPGWTPNYEFLLAQIRATETANARGVRASS